jgi:hypothetical protein
LTANRVFDWKQSSLGGAQAEQLAEKLFSLGGGGFQPPHKRFVTNRALAPEESFSVFFREL